LTIDFLSSFNHSYDFLSVYASPPLLSLGVKNRKYLRNIKIVEPNITDSIDIEPEWLSAFGFSSLPDKSSGQFYIMWAIGAINSSNFLSGSWLVQSF